MKNCKLCDSPFNPTSDLNHVCDECIDAVGGDSKTTKGSEIDIIQSQVRDFMIKAGQDCPAEPLIPDVHTCTLRLNLIEEELKELGTGFASEDLIEVADAIVDLLVVVVGTAVACGIDIKPVFDEVHRSNMTKFIDGHRREDGKWIKGKSYTPANIAPIIEAQSK